MLVAGIPKETNTISLDGDLRHVRRAARQFYNLLALDASYTYRRTFDLLLHRLATGVSSKSIFSSTQMRTGARTFVHTPYHTHRPTHDLTRGGQCQSTWTLLVAVVCTTRIVSKRNDTTLNHLAIKHGLGRGGVESSSRHTGGGGH